MFHSCSSRRCAFYQEKKKKNFTFAQPTGHFRQDDSWSCLVQKTNSKASFNPHWKQNGFPVEQGNGWEMPERNQILKSEKNHRSTTGKVHVGFLCATSVFESELSIANSRAHSRSYTGHASARTRTPQLHSETHNWASATHTRAYTHTHTGKIDTLMWLRRPVLHRGQRHAVHTQTLSTVEVTHILLYAHTLTHARAGNKITHTLSEISHREKNTTRQALIWI